MQSKIFTKLIRSFTTKPQFPIVADCAVFSSKPYDIEYFEKINKANDPKSKINFTFNPEELNHRTAKLVSGSDTVSAFVNDKLDHKCLKVLADHGVNLIALRCAGFNNVDFEAVNQLGMKVVRVPAYSPYAVAEHAMALLLTLNRKTHKAYNRTKDGNFSLVGLLGFDLHGKNVGLIGAGKIGRCFASICMGFGMNVSYFDPKVNESDGLGKKVESLDEIFKNSDVISLHCPLNDSTKHIINATSLAKMKNNVVIVNTGRGGLIKASDVVHALKKKQIRGLAIDVYEQEEHIFFKDCSSEIINDDTLIRLLSFSNVLVTGHQAFFTEEALTAIYTTTINNILDFRRTGNSQNFVEPQK